MSGQCSVGPAHSHCANQWAAAASRGDAKALRRLLLSLGDDDPLARASAYDALAPLYRAPLDGQSAMAVDAITAPRDAQFVALLGSILQDHHGEFCAAAALRLLSASRLNLQALLVSLLTDADAELRIYAALLLGMRGDGTERGEDARMTESALVLALSDADENVAFHAAEALGRLRAVGAVDALTRAASRARLQCAYAALDALAAIGAGALAAQAAVVALLDDTALAETAARALGELGDAQSCAPLLARLNRISLPETALAGACIGALIAIERRLQEWPDAAAMYRETVADGLNATGIDAVFKAAQRELGPARGHQRAGAVVILLGWLDSARARAMLLRLSRADAPIARAAVAELSRHGALYDLIALSERAGPAQVDAINALAERNAQSASATLLARLDADGPVRLAAVKALGRLDAECAFEPLLSLLVIDDAPLRQAVIDALTALAHPHSARRARELLRWPDAAAREAAIELIGALALVSELPALLAHTRTDVEADARVRRAALRQLPRLRLGAPALGIDLHDELQRVLTSDVASVRAQAAHALRSLDEVDATRLLLTGLADPDLWVRYYAARAASGANDASVLAALKRAALSDPAPPVRIAALEALGPRDADLARDLTGDPNFDLAQAARGVLKAKR